MLDEDLALPACGDGLTPPERLQRLAVALEAGQDWDEPPAEEQPATGSDAAFTEGDRSRSGGWGKLATVVAILASMTAASAAIYSALMPSAARQDAPSGAASAAVALPAVVPAELVAQSAPPTEEQPQSSLPPEAPAVAVADDNIPPRVKAPSQFLATPLASSPDTSRDSPRPGWTAPASQRVDYPVASTAAAMPPTVGGLKHPPAAHAAGRTTAPAQYNWLGGGGG